LRKKMVCNLEGVRLGVEERAFFCVKPIVDS
jgi:hypothetical protein